MNPAADTLVNAVPLNDPAKARPHTPGRSDGLGDRLLMFDAASASSLELLRFKAQFSDSLGFEVALRKRMDALSPLRHPSIAAVRTVKWLGAGEGLALVSTHTAGRRLSEIVQDARGPAFAMELIRQLAPALAALQQQSAGAAHGLLTTDRIIVTREGRLVMIEHVLGSAVESLKLSADRLRADLGIAVPAGPEPFALDSRCDVVQLGFIALSLLLGRRLEPADYPTNVPKLLEELARVDARSNMRLRPWLERSLQVGPVTFGTAQEALDGFFELTTEPDQTADVTRAVEAIRRAAQAGRPGEAEAAGQAAKPAEAKTVEKAADKAGKADKPHAETVTNPAASQTKASLKSRPKRNTVFWAAASMTLLSVAEGCFIGYVLYAQSLTVQIPTVIKLPAAASLVEFRQPTLPTPAEARPEAPPPAPAANDAAAAAPAKNRPADPVVPVASAGPRFGGVRVSSPIELQVFEGGKLVGSTSGPLAVLEGSHVLDFVSEPLGYRTRESVEVKAGQMAALSLTMPNGRISINAVPWATVTIDGVSAGDTPLANLSIAIGQHEIVFKHPQLGEQRQTVVVKADALARVSAVLRGGQQ